MFLRTISFQRLGVDFTNILRAAFMPADPKSGKNTKGLTVFFALLGSVNGKALCKRLMKLTPNYGCWGSKLDKTKKIKLNFKTVCVIVFF